MIQVTGSAKFIQKEDIQTTDETFTLAFQSRSYYDSIPVTTPLTFPKQCKHYGATHVINKIIYGQNAYFFFRSRQRNSEESQEIGGSLEVIVKSIPTFAIEGKTSIDLQGTEKKVLDMV